MTLNKYKDPYRITTSARGNPINMDTFNFIIHITNRFPNIWLFGESCLQFLFKFGKFHSKLTNLIG